MSESQDVLDRMLLLEVLAGEDAEDLFYLLREEIKFLRVFRRQTLRVQQAYQAHRRIRSEFFSLSHEEAGDWRDPIFRATGQRA